MTINDNTQTPETTDNVSRQPGLSTRLSERSARIIEEIRGVLSARAVAGLPKEQGEALTVRIPVGEIVERALAHYLDTVRGANKPPFEDLGPEIEVPFPRQVPAPFKPASEKASKR